MVCCSRRICGELCAGLYFLWRSPWDILVFVGLYMQSFGGLFASDSQRREGILAVVDHGHPLKFIWGFSPRDVTIAIASLVICGG